MRRLKRFRNWLGYVYYACWAFGQQFSTSDSYPAEKRAAEQGNSAPVYVALVDSGPTVAAQPSSKRSQAVESSTAPAPAQVEPVQVEEIAKPIEHVAATLPEESLEKRLATDKECVVPIAESKKVVTPAQKVATVPQRVSQPQVPQPPVAVHPSVVSSPKPQAQQTLSANVKPKGTNGAATDSRSVSGKYVPGTVNDQTAQRLARLLVSEIKLYYKSKTDGESESEPNNIYDVLKDPIDKSRQHYKRRMGENAIKTMPDYFHGELVRSLCGGDPSRLGPNYQGSVEGT